MKRKLTSQTWHKTKDLNGKKNRQQTINLKQRNMNPIQNLLPTKNPYILTSFLTKIWWWRVKFYCWSPVWKIKRYLEFVGPETFNFSPCPEIVLAQKLAFYSSFIQHLCPYNNQIELNIICSHETLYPAAFLITSCFKKKCMKVFDMVQG